MTNRRFRILPDRISPLDQFTLLAVCAFWASAPANAQISLGIGSSGVVCNAGGGTGQIFISDNNDDCDSGLAFPTGLEVYVPADFYGTVDFNSTTVQFNTSTVAFGGGTASFNNTVSFTGPSVTFSTATTFQNPATFNGTTNFTAGMTTTSITNSGSIGTSSLNATTALTASAGANVNLGGNIVHGVAAGVANTDAVNVSQLNAATSGITTSVTALQNTVATQGTAITAIQAVDSAQSSQIATLQATQDTLFDLRARDRRDMKQGVAAAMSMANAPMPSGPGKVTYAVSGATFRGEYAVGGSLQYRLNTAAPMAINVGASFAGNKNNGVRVGVAGEF